MDAVFSQFSVMSAAGLRELAGALPRPSGNAGNLPPILAFMPHHGYQANTEKYAEGPLGLSAIAIASSGGAWWILAPIRKRCSDSIPLGSGDATLLLIEYPTPALAAEHLRRIDAAHHLGQSAEPDAGVSAIENVGPFFDKRTGPIVAIAAGPLSESDAQTLLGAVNWSPSVTWNENTYFDKKNNIANLLVNIILLCMIVGAISLAAGVAFGGAKVLLRRYFPGNVFGHSDQEEFISLDLRDRAAATAELAGRRCPIA